MSLNIDMKMIRPVNSSGFTFIFDMNFRLFAAWRVEAPFFRVFTFRWALQFAFSLTRCLTLQDTTPYSGEDTLYECGRPCDKLSCLFFTALWLRQRQSTLVQDIQPAKDIDLTCYKTLPIKTVTCLQVEPMSP